MFSERCKSKLDLQKQNKLYRNPPVIDHREGKYIYSNGVKLINFSSNDYLGLGACEQLRRNVADNFSRYGSSASSSRLVSGNFKLLQEAEKVYADFFGYEDALFFSSGYQANMGILSAFFQSGDVVLFDKHIHASSVRGLTLSGATALGYNHNSFSHLEKRLKKSIGQVGLLTESLFSMDGDSPDFERLKGVKREYDFFCILDEAHSFGVLGPGGRGLGSGVADVAVGTFGKALGLFGAFVLLSSELKDYLLNFSSPQIYTTALPEAHAASALDALSLIAEKGKERRHLYDISRWLENALQEQGFHVQGDAHILSVEIGDEQKALDMAYGLLSKGFFVLPARYPTVPLKKAILRISLTVQHTEEDLEQFIEGLRDLGIKGLKV